MFHFSDIVALLFQVDAQTGESISYKELLALTCSLGKSLTNIGCGKDAVIAISSENNLQFYIPVIAGLYVGAIVAPINFNYTPHELHHTLNITKPQIIFCSKAVAKKYISVKKELNFIKRIIILDSEDDSPEAESLTNFISNNLGQKHLIYEATIASINPKEHVAFVMCSSGTTGLPKGVMQTHYNIMTRHQHAL